MTTHILKILPDYYAAVADGRKNFELRYDDRGFKVGDVLELREHSYQGEDWELLPTGRVLERRVCYLLTGPLFGLEAGFSIMALGPV